MNGHARVAAPPSDARTCLTRLGYEVRGSINSMLGIAELLRDTRLTAEQTEYIDVLRASADRLLAVTGDIVELAADVPSSVQPATFVEFSLDELLRQTAELLGTLAVDVNVRIALTVDPALAGVFLGDRQRVEEVLVTLLNNSIRAAIPGEIAVAAISRPGKGAEFRISAPSLFGSSAYTDIAPALAERQVTALGGEFASQHTPAQTTYDFSIPLGHTAGSPRPATARRQRARVFLAEDCEDNQFVIRRYLRNQPYEVDVVGNGRLAVEYAQAAEYDIILMDLEMPEMNGMAATEEIRASEKRIRRSPAVIVALTAHTGGEEAARCLAAGFTAYVSKPVNRKTILAVLAQYTNLAQPS
jgi:CheY-like chemotaxis protein